VQRDLTKDHPNPDICSDVGARVIDFYRRRIDGRSQTGEPVNLVRKTNEI